MKKIFMGSIICITVLLFLFGCAKNKDITTTSPTPTKTIQTTTEIPSTTTKLITTTTRIAPTTTKLTTTLTPKMITTTMIVTTTTKTTTTTVLEQGIMLPVTVSNDDSSRDLIVGLSSSATDGIDKSLGELDVPPMPPAGVFEARLALPDGVSNSYKDLRGFPSDNEAYVLHFQSTSPVTISLDLEDGMTGTLNDIVTGEIIAYGPFTGKALYTVDNPAVFSKIKLTLEFE